MIEKFKKALFLMRPFNGDKSDYEKLGTFLKYDLDVIMHMLKSNKERINWLENAIILDVLKKDITYLKYMKEDCIADFLKSINIEVYDDVEFAQSFIENLPSERSKEIFKERFPIVALRLLKIDSVEFLKILNGLIVENLVLSEINNIDEDSEYYEKELIEIIINQSDDEFVLLLKEIDEPTVKRVYNERTKKIIDKIFKSFDVDHQIRLYDMDNKIYDRLSFEARTLVSNRLMSEEKLTFDSLDEDIKLEYLHEHKGLLDFFYLTEESFCVLKNYFIKYPQELTAKQVIFYFTFSQQFYRISNDLLERMTIEEKKKLYNLDPSSWFLASIRVSDFSDNWETSMLESYYDSIKSINDPAKREKIKKYVDEIADYLKERKYPNELNITERKKMFDELKIFYSDRIINNNTIELISKYIETRDEKLLVEMLCNAYGEHVVEILKERPELSVASISNFAIFEKNVYDLFGKSFIHFLLNYDWCDTSYSSSVLGLILNDKEELDIFYKYHKCYLSFYKNANAGDMAYLLNSYPKFRNLFSKTDIDSLDEKQKNNLKLLLIEENDQNFHIDSLEELTNYQEKRNLYYKNMIEKANNKDDIKRIIIKYLAVSQSSNKIIAIGNEISTILKVFNVYNIINNSDIINEMKLNDNDIQLLLILNTLNNFSLSKQTLINIFDKLTHADCLNPIDYYEVFSKIKTFYERKFMDDLTIMSDLKKESAKDYYVTDECSEIGLIHVFTGRGFNFIGSVLNINMSTSKSGGDPYQKLFGEELLYDWLNREKGTMNISTTLLSSDLVRLNSQTTIANSDAYDEIIFLFEDAPIIAMGGSDIWSSYLSNNPIHTVIASDVTSVGYRDIDDIKIGAQKSYQKTKDGKFTSEIVLPRHEENMAKILKQNTKPRRTMPRGMYIPLDLSKKQRIGNKQYETYCAFKKYYEEHGLGEFYLIVVDISQYTSNSVNISEKQETTQPKTKNDYPLYDEVLKVVEESEEEVKKR